MRMQLIVLPLSLLLVLPKLSVIVKASAVSDSTGAGETQLFIVPTSQFAVQLPGQSEITAREIAARHGLKFIAKVTYTVCMVHYLP